MVKCSWCPWKGDIETAQFATHMRSEHPVEYRKMKRSLRELDEDIKAAQRQAGYPVDEYIDDSDLEDEDLSNVGRTW